MDMASPFERFQRLEIGFLHLNQIVDIGRVCAVQAYIARTELHVVNNKHDKQFSMFSVS